MTSAARRFGSSRPPPEADARRVDGRRGSDLRGLSVDRISLKDLLLFPDDVPLDLDVR